MCTCKNPDQPEPVNVVSTDDFAYPRMSQVRAPEDILVPTGMPGTSIKLYNKGDIVTEEDAIALGLAQPQVAAQAAIEPPKDKAKRGPREAGKATRDKALSQKEE